MTNIAQLIEVRQHQRAKESRVEHLLRAERADVRDLIKAVNDERDDRDRFRDRRHELAGALEEEIELDSHGKGLHGEAWELWAEARRDELADLVDGCESRIDRLIERVAINRDNVKELLERDESLEGRIDRINEKIERKRKDKAGRLSPHFHVVEFDCHDGTPVPRASYDALKAHCGAYLEPLRAKYGAVHVNSGYRTLSYNASIGGASMSVHVYDANWQHSPWAVAVDHVAAGASPSQVQAWHEANTHPDGMGRYGSFTHVDNRNRIGWADSRWVGP